MQNIESGFKIMLTFEFLLALDFDAIVCGCWLVHGGGSSIPMAKEYLMIRNMMVRNGSRMFMEYFCLL